MAGRIAYHTIMGGAHLAEDAFKAAGKDKERGGFLGAARNMLSISPLREGRVDFEIRDKIAIAGRYTPSATEPVEDLLFAANYDGLLGTMLNGRVPGINTEDATDFMTQALAKELHKHRLSHTIEQAQARAEKVQQSILSSLNALLGHNAMDDEAGPIDYVKILAEVKARLADRDTPPNIEGKLLEHTRYNLFRDLLNCHVPHLDMEEQLAFRRDLLLHLYRQLDPSITAGRAEEFVRQDEECARYVISHHMGNDA